MRIAVRIARQKEQLDALAKVKFSWSDIAELAELATIYAERFSEPLPDEFLADDPFIRQRPQTIELNARRAFVEAVEWVWQERRRRRGRGAFASRHKGFDGPLLRLLQQLFVVMGEKPPSAATLYDDIMQHKRRR